MSRALPVQRRRWPWIVLATLISFHVLLAYGLPPSVPLGGALVLAILYRLVGPANAMMVALSLVLATLLYAGALHLIDWEHRIDMRPDQMLSDYDAQRAHRAYLPHREVRMQVRQGDLQSMTLQEISEPHTVVCITDQDGFRNRTGYAGEPHLLVGDSFIAGVNNTQDDILSEQLRRDHAITAHNAAHPGDLEEYVRYVQGFAARHGGPFQVVLFLFEGNDFPAQGEDEMGAVRAESLYETLHRGYKRYLRLFSHTSVYRYTSSVYKRARNMRKIEEQRLVRVLSLGGEPLALYEPYVRVSEQASYTAPEGFEELLLSLKPRLAHIFFIPTKYRVYHRHLAQGGSELSHARWEYLHALCERHDLGCTDLTAALRRASERLLESGDSIWWRGDTHWNAQGIAAAARVVAATLAPSREGQMSRGD